MHTYLNIEIPQNHGISKFGRSDPVHSLEGQTLKLELSTPNKLQTKSLQFARRTIHATAPKALLKSRLMAPRNLQICTGTQCLEFNKEEMLLPAIRWEEFSMGSLQIR